MSKISIKHLSKSFGDKKVLDDINLEIEQGDIYGILGLSGAGKSTLVRCINGLENFDEGEIDFNNQLLVSPKKKIENNQRRKIAMIFQSFNLLQQRNVLQNVELALEIAKCPKAEREKKALDALKRVGLEDKLKSYPSELSGGQCQRVAIARALVLEPEVILSDEATSALDPETTFSILDLFKKLNEDLGVTIIMISHQMNAIERICNKVAIISKSKIIESGNLNDVFLSPQSDITKQLIYAGHLKTQLNEHHHIRLLFDGNTNEPIVANIIQDCSILVSIVYADTKEIEGKIYGQLVIRRPKLKSDQDKLKAYLDLHKIKYEEVKI